MKYIIEQTKVKQKRCIYPISGAKNAVLPQMCAGLLVDHLTIHNVPNILDVQTLKSLIESLGGKINFHKSTMSFNMTGLHNSYATYKFVSKMRASILILAPLLTKLGKANVAFPGGCVIGNRPINFHLTALKALGAEITLDSGNIIAEAKKGLHGANISLPFPSVGATEQILLAAVLAKGTTEILNAATEPEITDFIKLLQKLGAKIHGIGTDSLIIEGVDALHPTNFTVMPDRIEAISIITLMAALRCPVILKNISIEIFHFLIPIFNSIGINFESIGTDSVRISYNDKLLPCVLQTGPYPGFPTDVQPQFSAMFSSIIGESKIKETVFENRFLYVPEFNRMGVDMIVEDNLAIIYGGKPLTGTDINVFDIRSGFASLILGFIAQGKTIVHDSNNFIARGYENFVEKLQYCGLNIH